MGLTITEKILLVHTKKKGISPGEFIWAKVDLCLGNDITAPLAIREFEGLKIKKVADSSKIALVCDHFLPAKDMRSANQAARVKKFADKYKIKNYFEPSRGGIEHALLPELGMVLPSNLVIGADSHTCTYGALGAFASGVGSTDLAACWATGHVWLRVPQTIKFIYYGKPKKYITGKDIILHTISDIGVDGALYKAMEFSGETIKRLSMDERFTICNMAIEAGAKSGIIEPDEITFDYIKQVHSSEFIVNRQKLRTTNYKLRTKLKSDKDAKYFEIREYDVRKLEPQVACPHSPANVRSVSKIKNVKLDQVFIGSCTNGRISDLRWAAKVLKGRKVNSQLRLIVIPATQNIYIQAIKEGLIEIFLKSGAVVSPPTCGPCLGGHMGVLGEGEVALATTNRNFRGRMGALTSKVYLANPAVAAASAVKGRIAHPDEL